MKILVQYMPTSSYTAQPLPNKELIRLNLDNEAVLADLCKL
jgi:hypothetical protein